MRNARRVLGDAAVVGESRYRFNVLQTRRAQGKPLGLKDGDTGFPESLSWYFLQQGHGTGSSLKCEEGEPVSPVPPSQSPLSPAGLTNVRQTSNFGLPFTRPLPPSSVRRTRRCGL